MVTTELADRPSITLAIMFKVGSRYETDQEAGVSHFLEHMFFKGSAKYAGAKEIAEAIEGVGGVLNAATDKELTMFWARVPRTKAKLAALKTRKPGERHPYVVGTEVVARYLTVVNECAQAGLTRSTN